MIFDERGELFPFLEVGLYGDGRSGIVEGDLRLNDDSNEPGRKSPGRSSARKEFQMSAREQWEREVEARVERGMSRPRAIRELAVQDPELHRRYIAEANEAAGRRV